MPPDSAASFPSTPADRSYADVNNILIQFAAHPANSEVKKMFNEHYCAYLDNPVGLFTDALCTKLSPDFLKLLIKQISTEIVAPSATQTDPTNLSTIHDCLQQASLQIDNHNPNSFSAARSPRRLSEKSMMIALNHAVENHLDTIHIIVGTAHLYFDTRDGPITFLDWSKIATAPFPVPTPRSSAGTSSPAPENKPPTSFFSPAPAPLSQADLLDLISKTNANALAQALSQSKTSPPTPSTATPARAPSHLPASSSFVNLSLLDPDVKDRYENRTIRKGPLLGSVLTQPFSSGTYYQFLSPDQVFLSDGTMFLIKSDPEEKSLLRVSVTLSKSSPSAIRAWYENVMRTCHGYGFYVHPFWCFREDHGGPRGFTTGSSIDDDLPMLMASHTDRHAPVIHRFLQACKFPESSPIRSIVDSCLGDGYVALKQIVFHVHPAFALQPATWITKYPTQGTLSLHEFYLEIKDFHQLKAFISDFDGTLDDPSEIDIFINLCRHSTYLNRVTLEERRKPSARRKYTGLQLVETLQKHLNAPDSPARLSPATPPASRFPNARTNVRPPFRRPVNAIALNTSEYPFASPSAPLDIATPSSPEDSPAPPETFDAPVLALRAIDVPNDDPDASLVFDRYCQAVMAIDTDRARANVPDCLVCGLPHRFADCPILQDTAFLRSHYIRYCSALRRDIAARTAAFPRTPLPPSSGNQAPRAHTVNAVETESPDSPPVSISDVEPDFSDFHLGRL